LTEEVSSGVDEESWGEHKRIGTAGLVTEFETRSVAAEKYKSYVDVTEQEG